MTQPDPIQAFLKGYLEAILATGEDENQEPLVGNYDPDNFSGVSKARAFIECRDFYVAYPDLIGSEAFYAGYLFWLARNKAHNSGEYASWEEAFGPAATATLVLAATACGSRTVTVEGGELFIN